MERCILLLLILLDSTKTGFLDFSTYLGGNNADIILHDCNGKEDYEFNEVAQPSVLKIDDDDNIIVSGWTGSADFPTKKAFQPQLGSDPYCHQYDEENFPSNDASFGDNFVTKIASNGSLIFSTYLGGFSTEIVQSLLIDLESNVIIGGVTRSSDFSTQNAIYPNFGGEISQLFFDKGGAKLGDIYLTKFQADGEIIFSTFLGGGHGEDVTNLQVDSTNNIIMSGITRSTDFPVTINSQFSDERKTLINLPESGIEEFLAKFDSEGNSVLYTTYLDNINPSGMIILEKRVIIAGGATSTFVSKNGLDSQNLEDRGLAIGDTGPPSFVILESNGKTKRSSYILLLPDDEIDRSPNILLIGLIIVFILGISSIIIYETKIRKREIEKPKEKSDGKSTESTDTDFTEETTPRDRKLL